MAYIYRVAFVLLLVFPLSLLAAVSSTAVYTCSMMGGDGIDGSAVAATVKRGNAVYGGSGTATCSGLTCSYFLASGSLGGTATCTVANTCPANSSLVGGVCTCTSPYVESGGSCVTSAKAVCDGLNAAGGVLNTTSVSGSGLSTCYSGTVVTASFAGFSKLAGVITSGTFFGPFKCGSSCTPVTNGSASSTAPPGATNEVSAKDCKPGEVWGQVNGLSTCAKADTTSFGGTSSAASNAGGSASNPTSGLGPNAPPTAVASTKTTDCDSSGCVTKTTFTNGTGVTVGTTTDNKPKESFCAENPGLAVCKNGSFSGGSCSSPPSCDGDAVQCAQATQAFKIACAFESSAAATSEENAYTAARAMIGDQTTGSGINSTVNISASSFDQTNLLGAEVGLSDLTVTVMGRATTLPLSGLNTWFDVLGKLLMGVTAILCMRIVARG